MKIDEKLIQDFYHLLIEHCTTLRVPEHMTSMSNDYANGLWRAYLHGILMKIPVDWHGKTVIDFGCKYGHLFPLLYSVGADKVIGVEIEDEYLKWGREVFLRLYRNAEFIKPEQVAYLPVQPDSTDVVIMNEVISHINPMFLELAISEAARCLKTGGILFISDGNNLSYPGYKEKLLAFYEAWENGPDGTKTDRDVVEKCYLSRRKKIIEHKYPELDKDRVEYLAKNTSGLWGDYLLKTIDHYVTSGELIRRPYRKGVCPTNPGSSGVVIEKSFYPQHILYILNECGFACHVVKVKPALSGNTPLHFAKYSVRLLQYYAKEIINRGWEMSASEGFQIVARKEH